MKIGNKEKLIAALASLEEYAPLAEDEFTIADYSAYTGITYRAADCRLRTLLRQNKVSCRKVRKDGKITNAFRVMPPETKNKKPRKPNMDL